MSKNVVVTGAVEFPGKINVSGEIRGHYSGCRMQAFKAINGEELALKVNTFFEEHGNLLVINTMQTGTNELVVTYTKVLTDEELDALQDFSNEVNAKMAERKAKVAEAKFEQEKAKREEEAEFKRLIAVGKKCEANHKKDKANANSSK